MRHRDIVTEPGGAWARIAAGLLGLLLVLPPAFGWAATMYTYEDETGAMVMTDRLESVPQQFRHRVRRIEQEARPDSAESGGLLSMPSLSLPTSGRSVSGPSGGSEATLADRVWAMLPEQIVPGMTKYQSVLLIVGFVLGSLCFATLTLTKNPGLQFAMKWALILVAGGTFYGLYFAELGTNLSPTGEAVTNPRNVLDRVRTQAKDLERVQQERLRGMERMGQIEDSDAGR